MATVTIYSSEFCPFCHAAKQLFAGLGADFEEITLDDRPDLRMKLSADHGGFKTVPMIFIGDDFIGGFQEAMALHGSGDLAPRLGLG
jgi:glutaredoxin 3